MTASRIDSLAEEAKANEAADAASPWKSVPYRTPVEGVYQGVRSRFQKVEHFNIGPGWMCFEVDGKLPRGVINSAEIDITTSPALSTR